MGTLLFPLALKPIVGFGLLNNVLPFFPICHSLSPSFHSQHLKISFYFFFPSFPGSSPTSHPHQFLSEDFLGILSSSILYRWPNQLILCPFIHFTTFSPLLISSNPRLVLLFHSLFSYFGPYILLHIFLPKISRACSSSFVIVHVSATYDTTGLIIIIIYLSWSRATCWPVPVSRIQKYLQRSATIPSASWRIVFHYPG